MGNKKYSEAFWKGYHYAQKEDKSWMLWVILIIFAFGAGLLMGKMGWPL